MGRSLAWIKARVFGVVVGFYAVSLASRQLLENLSGHQ